MNVQYRTELQSIRNLEDTFGNPKTKIETKINKLNMAMRDNQDFKKYMLNVLEDASGKNFKATLAGLASQNWLPR